MSKEMFSDDFKLFLEWVAGNASLPFNFPSGGTSQECLDYFHAGKREAFLSVQQYIQRIHIPAIASEQYEISGYMYSLEQIIALAAKAIRDYERLNTVANKVDSRDDIVSVVIDQMKKSEQHNDNRIVIITALEARIKELEAQLAELTAPKPAICDNCNSKIEGEIHLRYMAHDTISLCGACVTENED